MATPSFLKGKDSAAAADDGPVQQARARARRRLIGAVVLLAIGVIVFPILFETKPRALPSDIPIQVARRDGGGVVIAPAPVPPPVSRPAPPTPAPPPADAGNEGAPATSPASAPLEAPKPEPAKSEPAVAEAPPAAVPPLAAEPASAPTRIGRYVVQVGAFTDALAVREARQKVEKLGLKTYTQEVDTPTGRRTRVRVGPFDSKAEADQAGARLKAAGLPVYLLLL